MNLVGPGEGWKFAIYFKKSYVMIKGGLIPEIFHIGRILKTPYFNQ